MKIQPRYTLVWGVVSSEGAVVIFENHGIQKLQKRFQPTVKSSVNLPKATMKFWKLYDLSSRAVVFLEDKTNHHFILEQLVVILKYEL